MTAETRAPTATVDLPIEGMTCASCVRRIEKSLRRVDGVSEAMVNLAAAKARVVFDPAVATMERLGDAVEQAGYAVGPAPEAGAATT